MLLGGRRSVIGTLDGRQHEDLVSSAAAAVKTEPTTPTMTASPLPPPPLPKRSVNRSTTIPQNHPPAPATALDESSSEASAHSRPDAAESRHTRGGSSASASSLSRAAHVPLPESRPGTPAPGLVEEVVAVKVTVNGDATTPWRTASPVGLTAPPPTPPPVPRRAAARNRGTVSGIVGDSSSDGVKKDWEGEGEGRKVDVEMVVVVAKEEEEAAAAATAAAETQGEEGQSEASEKMDDDETKTVTAELEKADRTVGGSDGQTWETEGGKILDKDDQQAQYVGTSTWEERTWRELVRIQKDMFYARIGAVHSVQRDT